MSLAGFLVKEYVVEKVRGHELEWQSAVQKPLRGAASTVMSDQGAVVYGHPTLREDDSDKSGDLLPKEGTAVHI